MNQFPIELWQKIFTLACVDGGYTGSSLSLTSHSFRHAVERVRFYCVALRSLEHAITFIDAFKQDLSRLTIRHLFIAPRDDIEEAMIYRAKRHRKLREAVQSILLHAAPTLITLFVGCCGVVDSRGLSAMSDLSFPLLRDLVLYKMYNYLSDGNKQYPFPAVERLYVPDSGSRNTCDASKFWRDCAASTPAIRILKLSSAHADPSMPIFIRAILRLPPSQDNTAASAVIPTPSTVAQFLPHLQDITVEPSLVNQLDYRSYGWHVEGQRHLEMLAGLRSIAEQCTSAGSGAARFNLLRGKFGEYTAMECLNDWLDVVNGGDGPWRACGRPHSTPGSYESPPERTLVLEALNQART